MPHRGVDSNDARCDTYIKPHGGAFTGGFNGKGKRHVPTQGSLPEDVRKAIEKNGGDECRQFNTELIYQLRKVYGLAGEKSAQA